MKLSENHEIVQKLEKILMEYPNLEYDIDSSSRMDNMLMVKTIPDAQCDIITAGNIAKILSESTGDQFKVQPRSGSHRSSLDDLSRFGLFLLTPNKNVRITYPDSKNDKIEVDIIDGLEMSLNLNDPQLWQFATGNELEIHFNLYAQPNYREYIKSHVTRFTRNDNNMHDHNFPQSPN